MRSKPRLEPDAEPDQTALSKKIIGCAFVVSNTLGAGFPAKVYENALAHELCMSGFMVEQQHNVLVPYDGAVVGTYAADLLVELVELKAVNMFDEIHRARCMNYLKAMRLWLCLLLNFGNPSLAIKRLVNG